MKGLIQGFLQGLNGAGAFSFMGFRDGLGFGKDCVDPGFLVDL